MAPYRTSEMQPSSRGARIEGVIEGFYGRPWTWAERAGVATWCADRGMRHYVYAPKDDPKHRAAWREPYIEPELDGFREFAGGGHLALGFALSPGLSIDYGADADRAALLAKLVQVVEAGASLVVVALDDIPPRPGLGDEQAGLIRWLVTELDDLSIVLVPTDYVNVEPNPYLRALADGVPDGVAIAWTGISVVNDEIHFGEAARRAAALGGRAPLIWDNTPANDGFMADRLFLGPLRGRDQRMLDLCSGYLANPMTQPVASRLPLASAAAWLRGDDAESAWAEEADRLQWRVFAEACDGELPGQLARRGQWDELRAWLEAARTCDAPGIDDDAQPWLDQVHREADVGLAALRLLDRGAVDDLIDVMFRWPALSRSRVSVMGPRRSFRPVWGQTEDGSWSYRSAAL
jgi:hyaluronoglucosaminidase